VLIAFLPEDEPYLGVLAFGLAGLGCSALLPLTISFGTEELASVSAAVAGGVIAFYQLGYGIAAFGVGPLLDSGIELPTIYGFAAVLAVAMGGVVVRRRPSGAEHGFPRPGTGIGGQLAGCSPPGFGVPGRSGAPTVSSSWYRASSCCSSSFFGKRKKTSAAPSRTATRPAV
jgi:hypothetical protein